MRKKYLKYCGVWGKLHAALDENGEVPKFTQWDRNQAANDIRDKVKLKARPFHRVTPLLQLPYFNVSEMSLNDPMHSIKNLMEKIFGFIFDKIPLGKKEVRYCQALFNIDTDKIERSSIEKIFDELGWDPEMDTAPWSLSTELQVFLFLK